MNDLVNTVKDYWNTVTAWLNANDTNTFLLGLVIGIVGFVVALLSGSVLLGFVFGIGFGVSLYRYLVTAGYLS